MVLKKQEIRNFDPNLSGGCRAQILTSKGANIVPKWSNLFLSKSWFCRSKIGVEWVRSGRGGWRRAKTSPGEPVEARTGPKRPKHYPKPTQKYSKFNPKQTKHDQTHGKRQGRKLVIGVPLDLSRVALILCINPVATCCLSSQTQK